MTSGILARNGYLNKYIGDGIMAVFGAPVPSANHAEEACLAALDNLEALRILNEELRAESFPTIGIRIGIGSGEMLVGLVGSQQKLEYTAMGDNVNLASRIEGASKKFGTVILINERCRELVHDRIVCREVDNVRVKGKALPTRLYEVLGKKGGSLPISAEAFLGYNTGLKLYREKKWQDARDVFAHVLKICPDDGPSSLYQERCTMFMEAPPADNWDGVSVLTEK
jgi:adenylate cyclase